MRIFFIFLVFFSINVYSENSSPELNIVFWNILEGGKKAQLSSGSEKDAIDQNLIKISLDPQVDVLILSEFIPGVLYPNTENTLDNSFDFKKYISYNSKRQNVGIKIYARRATNFYVSFTELDWYSGERMKNNWETRYPIAKTDWARRFITFSLEIEGKRFNIFPVHLLQPWIEMKSQMDWLSKERVGMEILFGKTNPLFHQLENLISKVKEKKLSSFLLIGDFNLPKSLVHISPVGYRLLKKNFKEVFKDFSYTQKEVKLKIDYAFSGISNKSTTNVLKLNGSDHYPIQVILK